MVTPVAVLIGPPGAGKTTIGRLLGERLQVPFVDTDDVVEDLAGTSISEIFVEQGEPVFRALEARAVADSLGRGGVISLGGGAPMQEPVAALLEGQPVVFLDVAIGDAAHRVGFDRSRPLLAVNPRATWTKLMNERRPTYDRLARWRVDTGGRKPRDIVSELTDLLGDDRNGE